MRHRASVWNRTGRLEASLQQVALQRELAMQEVAVREAVAHVAEKHGLEPAEVLAKAQALVDRAVAAGARTDAEVVALVAKERGMTEAELRAEVARRGGDW